MRRRRRGKNKLTAGTPIGADRRDFDGLAIFGERKGGYESIDWEERMPNWVTGVEELSPFDESYQF